MWILLRLEGEWGLLGSVLWRGLFDGNVLDFEESRRRKDLVVWTFYDEFTVVRV